MNLCYLCVQSTLIPQQTLNNMKRLFLIVTLCAVTLSVFSQNYFVYTNGARHDKHSTNAVANADDEEEDVDESQASGSAFVRKHFRHYNTRNFPFDSKFMVMPEKYDYIVPTFRSRETGKDVENASLREHIFLYKGHSIGQNGRARINFTDKSNGNEYYYEIAGGGYDDFCMKESGIPTLAFLDDVDTCRNLLVGKKVYTMTSRYYVDNENTSDGWSEVSVPKGTLCTVKAVGVGTRRYSVKIVCEQPNGELFFQHVTISRTNCGMRDNEFIMDEAIHLFDNSFQLADDGPAATSPQYKNYLGRRVYTKYVTRMTNIVKNQDFNIFRMSQFIIRGIEEISNSSYVNMTLESRDGTLYRKKVTFTNNDVVGDIDGQHEDYYPYLFGEGTARGKSTTDAQWRAIQGGRVINGMSKEQVKQAIGEPGEIYNGKNQREDWIFNDVMNDRRTIVKFRGNKVIAVKKY